MLGQLPDGVRGVSPRFSVRQRERRHQAMHHAVLSGGHRPLGHSAWRAFSRLCMVFHVFFVIGFGIDFVINFSIKKEPSGRPKAPPEIPKATQWPPKGAKRRPKGT